MKRTVEKVNKEINVDKNNKFKKLKIKMIKREKNGRKKENR